ncbi:hypothetical protein P154DRAFT_447722 [Amniculicola lignicola CBS 123094]|uniref:C2H2-type domain-containing protein n=1 Tax=Amniculicola lignicola CBS 123094 TaxID=1392246 RepID=A0A6A5VZM5_9PLEO|nr:hypothetical protein P154DRAFT_447722 [Amniculicola lignicola CBS 123094]
MTEFHRTFDSLFPKRSQVDDQPQVRTCHGGGSSGSAAGGAYKGSTTNSTANLSSSFVSRKRSLSGGPPGNDGEEDPNKRQKPDSTQTSGPENVPEPRFACPFYKRNPRRHLTFTSCRDPGFTTVARLKEHLYRRHLLPIQCNRCCATFSTEPLLREHQRDARGCEIREQAPLEGFNKDQERKLKSKRRSPVVQTEEDKWKRVYHILFPDDPAEAMPSPLDIEYNTHHDDQPSEDNSNVARFQEFSRLELPRLVRRTLEIVVEHEAQPLEDKLKDRLVDIVKECQTQLFSMFQTSHGSSDVVSSVPVTNAAEHDQLATAGAESSFPDFDSFLSSACYLPSVLEAKEPMETLKSPDLRASPERATSGTPDSGYDSTWTNIVPEMLAITPLDGHQGQTNMAFVPDYRGVEDGHFSFNGFDPEVWSFLEPGAVQGSPEYL